KEPHMQSRLRNVFSQRDRFRIRPGLRIPTELERRFSNPDDEPDVLEIKGIERKLKENLLTDLPFFRLGITPLHCRKEILDAYLESVAMLADAAVGLSRFFETLIISLVWLRIPRDHKQRRCREVVAEFCELMSEQLQFVWEPPSVVVTADLV